MRRGPTGPEGLSSELRHEVGREGESGELTS